MMGWSVLLFLVVVFLASSVTTEKCGTEWDEPDDVCLAGDTGYWVCEYQQGNWKHGEWKTVNCASGQLCRCKKGYMIALDSFQKTVCTCAVVNKPSFPQTGVIRWNGTLTIEPYPYLIAQGKKRTVEPVHGLMYMDDAGYFLLKKDYFDRYDQRQKVVKIMVPKKNGKFTKITRENQGTCHVNDVDENKESLEGLWDVAEQIMLLFIYRQDIYWHLQESTAAGVQKWGGNAFIDQDYGPVRWTLTVEKSKDKDNVAIPKHLLVTISESSSYRTDITFTYDSVSDTLKEKLKDGTERSSAAFFQLLINKYCPKQK